MSSPLQSHAGILEYFRQCALREVLSHAYIVTGPQFGGVTEVMRSVLEVLNPGERIVVAPEETKSKTGIRMLKVDQIRALKERLSGSSLQSGYRVVHIQEAEKMESQAGNAMLKVLEEPPEQTIFFIETTSLDALLPTIISRCQVIRVGLLSDTEIDKMLGVVKDVDDRADLVALCAGRVDLASEMASNTKKRNDWLKKWREITALCTAPLEVQMKLGTKLDENELLLLETALHRRCTHSGVALSELRSQMAGLIAARQAMKVHVPMATALEQVWLPVMSR